MTRASVIVPVHGHAALTRRCLDLVLADLPADCEAIVVDDASPDTTPQLLRDYGERIRVISLGENVGFSRACNAGAEAAAGEGLVFLNNDTEPQPGWIEALLGYAARHRRAQVVGAKLVFPTGAVQHAGVVFGQDGYPHNLYAGLPQERPEVNRSRRLQAVTGACMLVRRDAFEAAGGFDEGYANSLEDVDLCLRIGAAGGEVHYCHEASVVHLESASRGRGERFERSVDLYRRRWRDRVSRDDVRVYAEDGLLAIEYPASYPLRMSVSPLLAIVDDGREAEIEVLLEAYARQVSDLLGEVMRLTAVAGAPAIAASSSSEPVGEVDHHALLAEANRLEDEARTLQERFAAAAPRAAGVTGTFAATERLGYRRLVERINEAVAARVPAGAAVLVVSRGDRDLLELGSHAADHFPQSADGGYLGHHPRDSEDAISRLEELRAEGAGYLVMPSTSYWWLDHYDGFAEHLRERYVASELGFCTIYRLSSQPRAAEREAIG